MSHDTRPAREARAAQALMALRTFSDVEVKFTEDEIAWAYDLDSYLNRGWDIAPKGYWL